MTRKSIAITYAHGNRIVSIFKNVFFYCWAEFIKMRLKSNHVKY